MLLDLGALIYNLDQLDLVKLVFDLGLGNMPVSRSIKLDIVPKTRHL